MPHKLSLDDWLTSIEQSPANFTPPNFKRTQKLARVLGLDQFACPVLTVAGTNGKGSCVAMLAAIYQAADYRVGCYTSPHLLKFNERAQIEGQVLADSVWVDAFAKISQSINTTDLNYFEFVTLAALYLFQQANLEVLILEVGLGGRLDTVNCVDADCAIITNIALDHCHLLGDDRESIGYEKAGIMRANKPAIYGEKDTPQMVVDEARKIDAKLYRAEMDFNYQSIGDKWSWQTQQKQYTDLPKPDFLIENAATVLMTIEQCQTLLPVECKAIKKGLRLACLPGRQQMLKKSYPVVLDVAHNPAAVCELSKLLLDQPIQGRNMAVVGFLQDKDIAATCQPIMAQIDSWYCAELNTPRSVSGAQILQILQAHGEKQCYNFSSLEKALAAAEKVCTAHDRIVVFGSFYTVSSAMSYWQVT